MTRRSSLHVSRKAGNGPDIIADTVDDPYDGRPLAVSRNARSSPVHHLYKRGRLGTDDEARPRVLAAVAFQRIYERAEIGGSRAIDYERAKVDTSFCFRGLPDRTVQALRELVAIREALRRNYDIIEKVAGYGMSLRAYANAHYGGHEAPGRAKKLFSDCLVAGLDDLILFFGVARGPVKSRVRAERAA